ncbi:hypothetical protein NECAME_15630 [Necator americanus]|uniref:Uncharacterized protein n=1 Tax=Necator americanus TaxID=51031 RepID=W2SGZ6_NECAM|nr:hypothetical protein NECAME_15630 [Necator americanus]ETN68798.1 hypothetical protein NECAME_15630 [Necator americanus]
MMGFDGCVKLFAELGAYVDWAASVVEGTFAEDIAAAEMSATLPHPPPPRTDWQRLAEQEGMNGGFQVAPHLLPHARPRTESTLPLAQQRALQYQREADLFAAKRAVETRKAQGYIRSGLVPAATVYQQFVRLHLSCRVNRFQHYVFRPESMLNILFYKYGRDYGPLQIAECFSSKAFNLPISVRAENDAPGS